ncbi:hypothetical protein IP92_02798 [Pseudoduganella flava]|uniref:Uncharacterized protein n=1 Tax=Pseudoduganella flava TaxID=871742 RepID=A0A562PTG1_9BURK|nr:hypothetical protein [Pseudoduganella flava]QGZ38998.1 hypothetical protein GO485_08010 [Pseudoduganella flava]TWI47737.1 hypothetical protein IP92_02798 [Pseudoduganella flava]
MRTTIIAALLAVAAGAASAQTSPPVSTDPQRQPEAVENRSTGNNVDSKERGRKRVGAPFHKRGSPTGTMTSGRSEAGKTSGEGDDDSRMQSGTSNGANSGTGDTRGNTTGTSARR